MPMIGLGSDNNRSAPFLLILQKRVARYFAYPIEIWNRAVSFLTSFESKNFMKLSLVNSIETYVLGKTKEKLSLKNIIGSMMGSSTYMGVHVPCTAVAFHKEGKFNFTPCHSVYSKSYWLIFVRASRDVFQHSKSSFNIYHQVQ